MPTVAEITAFLQSSPSVVRIDVREDRAVVAPAGLSDADASSLTFVRDAAAWSDRPVGLLIAPADLAHDDISDAGAVVLSERPRLDFVRVVTEFFAPPRPVGIDPAAVVHAEATIANTAYIGPGSTIGRATVGAGTVIHAGVHLYDGVTVGERCTIHSGTVIGSDGFGFAVDEDGAPQKFQHLGGVSIGDDVEVGSNTSIDRGTLGDTLIEDRAKIDNLIHIAHNVRIGADTMIAAGAMVAGSTTLGKRCWVGPQAAISNGLTLGDDVFVTLGSVVTRDVEDSEKVTGYFAVPHARFLEHLRSIR